MDRRENSLEETFETISKKMERGGKPAEEAGTQNLQKEEEPQKKGLQVRSYERLQIQDQR